MRFPDSLRDAVRKKRLLPFAGAGVSMAVKSQDGSSLLPSWKELLEAAADRLDFSGDETSAALVRAQANANRYLEAAKDAQAGLDRDWPDFLKSQIEFDPDTVNRSTLDLPQALWSLADPVIITTNYDRILRLAHPHPEALSIWDIEAPAEQGAFLRGRESSSTLWYLHGQIDNASNIILTPDGYKRLYGSNKAEEEFSAAKATLQSLLKSHMFLFVGFSFSDPALGAELRAFDQVMKGATGSHYVLVREQDAEHIRGLGLPVQPIAIADYGLPLVEALRELADTQREEAVSTSSTTSKVADAQPVADFSPKNPVFFVPYRAKGDGVIGRAEALQKVRDQLETGSQTSIGQTAAFRGLGGLGKTQLAVEYATTYRDAYPSGVVWLTADQEIEAQLAEIAEVARWVSPKSEHRYKLDIALQRIRTFDDGLIIFDNVERLEDIEPFLPLPIATPHLLLTSRVEIPNFIPISLSTLSDDDSYRLLLQESGRIPENQEASFARKIADRLDGLPLALELAGAYLRHRSTSFEDYFVLLDSSLPDAFEKKLLSSFTKHDADLASTLAIHESVINEAPALQAILDVLTWSASSPMGLSLLQATVPDISEVNLRKALDLGEALRLLKVVPGAHRYAIHRLVAEIRRAREDPASEWIITTARYLATWFREHKEDFESLGDYELDFDHLDAWFKRVRPHDTKLAAELLWLEAYPPYHRGQAELAKERIEEARILFGDSNGVNEALDAHLRNDHGFTLGLLGFYADALKLVQEALDIRRIILDENHPDIALSLDNVGAMLNTLGRYEGSLHPKEKALAIRLNIFGDDHPDTASSLGSVSATLSNLGRHQEALELAQQALEIRRNVLGENHPDTALSLDSVGTTLYYLGRYDADLQVTQQALEIRRNVLGENHPSTAHSLESVGATLYDLGQFRKAQENLEAALSIYDQRLGSEHPHTVSTLQNLIQIYVHRGNTRKGLLLVERYLKELNRDHPSYPELRDLRDSLKRQIPGMRNPPKRRK